MMSANHDTLVFIVPIFGLKLTKEISNEIKICKVTFITKDKLKRTRVKFGIPNKFSEYKDNFLNQEDVQTVAIIRHSGKIKEIRMKLYKIIEEELYILLSSFFRFKQRDYFHNVGFFGNGKYSYFQDIFILSTNELKTYSSTKAVNNVSLMTDLFWKNYQRKYHFFFRLLKVINSKTNKFKELKRIAFLSGKSFNSNDIVDAFLYNMIIIDTLLTNSDDKQKDAILNRINAFFEWLNNWKESTNNNINELYNKRSAYVHNLEYEKITVQDVCFTDELIFNLLVNIVKHPKIFSCKNDLIQFSKKVEAEKILGISKTKTRPKTFAYSTKTKCSEDYNF